MVAPFADGGGLLLVGHQFRRSQTRLSESRPELGQDAADGDIERTVEGATAGVAMSAAAEVLGDAGYIELAFTADTEPELTDVGDFAEEDRRFDAGDADEVIDDAFTVFCSCSDAVHVFCGDPGPGDVAFAVEIGKGDAEEADFAGWIGEVDVSGDLAWVGSVGGEVVDEGEGVGGGAGVGEGSRVGEDGGVKTGGHRGCDADSGRDSDAVDHGGDSAGMLIDPVDGAEGSAAGVMVNVDEDAVFEAEKSGAGDTVALEQDGGDGAGWIDVVGGDSVVDAVEVGKGGVGGGYRVGEEDVGPAAELVENFSEGEDGADGVSVGARVRGEEEAGLAAEESEEIGDAALVREGFGWLSSLLEFVQLGLWSHDLVVTGEAESATLRFRSRFRVRSRSSSMRLVIFWERSMAKVSSGT